MDNEVCPRKKDTVGSWKKRSLGLASSRLVFFFSREEIPTLAGGYPGIMSLFFLVS
jgi:hypothetical protein